jgi:hypothetical protein
MFYVRLIALIVYDELCIDKSHWHYLMINLKKICDNLIWRLRIVLYDYFVYYINLAALYTVLFADLYTILTHNYEWTNDEY